MQLIDGKQTSRTVKDEIALEVKQMVASAKKRPHLAAVLVGNDGGSETYVAAKIKACEEVGFSSTLVRFDEDVSEQELLAAVNKLNKDEDIDGFIVQLPLPSHISEERITEAIDPSKDVDGFHPQNLGRMITGSDAYISATPQGIMELIKRYGIETSGKHVVIIGRSNIVGRPLSILLSLKGRPGDATVTLCHSRTQGLKELCLQADIIVAALGIPEFLKEDMVKEGAVVIDVGTTRVPSSKTKSGWRLKGDVDFEKVAPKCSYITPVPGGVGPMTIASLLLNTLKAARKK
ncbi:MAG TPA: bifunctional 5,10-methylene-tetrahydrofolate dehydrogenase/5,10-methylene-tetrahydrofolate cyclohydrolase [Marinilabiliaceae bacterium]|nr:bifunctional 5,10-methylene-tetrahydrofolate dehydrogenase/5,10-methylene-tetrahydrofolate cyclohydrolase [Marinilabiliaceae bacterium]HBX88590.1 bifunctional 5,10-methylene-tetrahydrofolate dehydrogenase/5,10-methylene-tetrahydrofolate cyclohydrolase [Marinilabiliaceae bacterium]